MLSLTQPAVSQHIRGLEQEYGIKIFLKGTKGMVLTPEGKILEKYARREKALYSNLLNDFEAYRNGVNRFVIGITPSAEENIVPRVIATYCNQYPDTKITILTDTIQNITNKLKAYEVDIAIVEGHIPDKGLSSILLDTDYLCLIVSPLQTGKMFLWKKSKKNDSLSAPEVPARVICSKPIWKAVGKACKISMSFWKSTAFLLLKIWYNPIWGFLLLPTPPVFPRNAVVV